MSLETVNDNIITLRSGTAGLQVCPAVGGSITRYWYEQDGLIRDWLRSVSADAIANQQVGATGCFPLVPFSGRIREGRFQFQDRTVELPLNFLPQRHAIHGQGWQSPWQVVEVSADKLLIEYTHVSSAEAWYWDYHARQTFDLAADKLTITLELLNTSSEAMPAGIGLHPYFSRTPQARLQANIEKVWLADDEVMPTELVTPTADKDINVGIQAEALALDNCFTGWNRHALLEWPEWNAWLNLSATSSLGFLVVYTPSGENFFCVEPVSHITDAFNYADLGHSNTGMVVLAPGEQMTGSMTLAPQIES